MLWSQERSPSSTFRSQASPHLRLHPAHLPPPHRRRQGHATYEVPAAASRLDHPTALDALFWAALILATLPTTRTVVKAIRVDWEDARLSPSQPIDPTTATRRMSHLSAAHLRMCSRSRLEVHRRKTPFVVPPTHLAAVASWSGKHSQVRSPHHVASVAARPRPTFPRLQVSF